MQKYELTLIFKSNLKEEERRKIIDKLEKIIKKGKGKIEKIDCWGKRTLAYEIKKEKDGVFYLLSFAADSGILPGLEKDLKAEEKVIRYLIVKS